MGQIRLSALISDGMVLQRGTENYIWGYAESGKSVRLVLNNYQTAVKVDETGYFELTLPPMKAGGPWEILLSDGEDCIKIRDVLFGDVFLLGGQSNMELPIMRVMERYGEELAMVSQDALRMFEVPKEYLFGTLRPEIEKGNWIKASGESLQLFSAVGYFAANELYKKEQVPIGLLQTAVGGTPVKAWSCEETVRRLNLDVAELDECRQEGYPAQVELEESTRENLWRYTALKDDGVRNCNGKIMVPGFLEGTELEYFHGGIRLHKTFVLPEGTDWKQEEATLYMGTVIDADITYVNGERIGETTYRYPPRIYSVPKGTLHVGENQIMLEMLVMGAGGGFMPGKPYALRFGEHKEKQIDLTGIWDYEVIHPMKELPPTTFFQYKASGLYQGMLYPIRRWRVKGCFFYQGESNTGRPETYEEEFCAMIDDWRALWKMEDLPFIFVQLAGYRDGKEHTDGINWAKLREAQNRVQKMSNTAMVQAYDLGEYNDLHPTDKKSVGQRIAIEAQRLIYGRDVQCDNPEVKELNWMENAVEVSFAPEGTQLHVVNGDEIQGFEWLCKSGERIPAQAYLGDEVVLPLPQNKEIVGLSYAWNDCPSEANLYNQCNLPVVPFERMRKSE